MTTLVQVSKETLVRALIKRAAVEVQEGKQTVGICWWCGRMIAVLKARPNTPPMFCRPPAKCRSRADNLGCKLGFVRTTEWIEAGAPRE